MDNIDKLKNEIKQREEELAALKKKLVAEEQSLKEGQDNTNWSWPLSQGEYTRYSRQMIVPSFGLQGVYNDGKKKRLLTRAGQQRIRKAKVLLVGAGGLGCPAAAYLAGAGVGTLGLADADEVEVSNLHRQVAHATSRVGMKKVDSAITYLKEYVDIHTYIHTYSHMNRTLTSTDSIPPLHTKHTQPTSRPRTQKPSSPNTTSSSTAPTTQPLAISSPTSASSSTNPSCPRRPSKPLGNSWSSITHPTKAPAIAACFPNHLHPRA